jgi:FkbM family methyltransferase
MLSPSVQGLVVQTQQGLFCVDPDDLVVGGRLLKEGHYGREEIARLESLAGVGDSILFVGAHIGALAVPMSKRVAKVVAIEANPKTFGLLQMNLHLNGCSNVIAHHFAAGESKGSLQFVQNRFNTGGSKRMPVHAKRMYFYDKPSVVEVACDRLDDRLQESFEVIVMDIEGSEYFAIQGMPRHLHRARHLVCEFLPHHIANVAGITAAQFSRALKPYFDTLRIPSKGLTVEAAQIEAALVDMFDRSEGDDALVFSKSGSWSGASGA